jgi:hypothetical protein
MHSTAVEALENPGYVVEERSAELDVILVEGGSLSMIQT